MAVGASPYAQQQACGAAWYLTSGEEGQRAFAAAGAIPALAQVLAAAPPVQECRRIHLHADRLALNRLLICAQVRATFVDVRHCSSESLALLAIGHPHVGPWFCFADSRSPTGAFHVYRGRGRGAAAPVPRGTRRRRRPPEPRRPPAPALRHPLPPRPPPPSRRPRCSRVPEGFMASLPTHRLRCFV